jgi:hypothetical protein
MHACLTAPKPGRSVKNALEKKKWPTIGPSIAGESKLASVRQGLTSSE